MFNELTDGGNVWKDGQLLGSRMAVTFQQRCQMALELIASCPEGKTVEELAVVLQLRPRQVYGMFETTTLWGRVVCVDGRWKMKTTFARTGTGASLQLQRRPSSFLCVVLRNKPARLNMPKFLVDACFVDKFSVGSLVNNIPFVNNNDAIHFHDGR